MSFRTDRRWMLKRWNSEGYLKEDYCDKLRDFLDFAFSNEENVERYAKNEETVLRIKCPCCRCKNAHYAERDDVNLHLLKYGFMRDYTTWWAHGEQVPNPSAKGFYDMIQDADEPLYAGCHNYSKLEAATKLLNWKLECNLPDSAYNEALSIMKDILPDGDKLVGNFYETKRILKKFALPIEKIDACKNHCMLFYKDDSCLTRCRVCGEYRYKNNDRKKVPNLVLTYMPITPRLQRLYMSNKMAKEMTWHHDHKKTPGMMVHPSDGEAWKHFDSNHPCFAEEIRNVRLGICTEGFSSNSSNSDSDSSWSVFLTIYNLPPSMGLKESNVKLALVIPGKKSPGQNLDVFLRPLVDELKMLYEEGVVTYDAYRKENFTMKAIVLWTVSDFPSYAILSGWSMHGKLACPYCMDKGGSFQLQDGGKICWFDCHRKHLPKKHPFRRDIAGFRARTVVASHLPPELTGDQIWEQIHHLPTVYEGVPFRQTNSRIDGFGISHNWVKKSILWELPYWRTLLIRHNLDVLHIEKSVFENLFNTVMDMPKTKDNMKARQDLETYCNRPQLHILKVDNKVMKPKAAYTLTKLQVRKVLEWLKKLKIPDGYGSNIGDCVNLEDDNFCSFKNQDCHMFMQRLLPIALKGMLPNQIWDVITELSTIFRILCSQVLRINDLIPLQERIIETVCKLEKVFPPGFFDFVGHLLIHLTREAILGGPVQYRWMYSYERKLGFLKRSVRNNERVDGSILESYLVNELATYCSLYFELSRESHNSASDVPTSLRTDSRLNIFKAPCQRLFDKGGKRRALTDDELKKAHTYILLNCEEVVTSFWSEFEAWIKQEEPGIEDEAFHKRLDEDFAEWFKKRVMQGSDRSTEHLKVLAQGPSRHVWSHRGYFVNGYKFHTLKHRDGRARHNNGVCVKGSVYNYTEPDYYGLLDEVLEVEYPSVKRCVVVLFKCTWFDAYHCYRGVRVDHKHNLVDVQYKSRLRPEKDGPFILASQATQVYYAPYPSMTNDLDDWWAIIEMKPRGIYEVAEGATETPDKDDVDAEDFFQEKKMPLSKTFVAINEDPEPFCLVTLGEFINVSDDTNTEVTDGEEEFEDTNGESDEDNNDVVSHEVSWSETAESDSPGKLQR
ncbi:hypothetical protein OSB04_010790 [Centaurea solstitialis]|uniref:Transposase n=1 Tax=Centaurea solstitialis TaxID=347529 RepID=A0AA38WPM3_9ASTR|nr:hypothetical protein OSB04_010790 [Centaurea solstitialis]